jgi:glycosyltransferase involved in cell wall biosynthesis
MKRLSIILPMYKVEPYVEKCVRSLLNQDMPYEDYEIICVNDGSPDNSRDVVQSLQKEADNILLVDQENQGVSMARNRGLKEAQGKYTLFIDPDDAVMENCLDVMLKEMELEGAQMAVPGYLYLDPSGREEGRKLFDKHTKQVFSGMEAFKLMREEKHIIEDSVVGILIETALLKENHLQFTKGVVLNQDAELMARLHCLAERLIFIDRVFYLALTRPGSATKSNQTATERVRDGFILAARNLEKFQMERRLSEEQMVFLNVPIAKFVFLALYSAMRGRSANALRKTIRSLKSAGLGRLRLKGGSGYLLMCGSIYNLSPYLGAMVLVLYLKLEHIYYSSVRKGNG